MKCKKMKQNLSDINNFKQVLVSTRKFLDRASDKILFSPYTIHPLVSQFLGLNTPLMGTGDSPYSLISIASEINKQTSFDSIVGLPLPERRRIFNEICDFTAPVMLGDSKTFINSYLTFFSGNACGNKGGRVDNDIRNNLCQKFKILEKFYNAFEYKKGAFAQIVHYGRDADLHKEFSFVRGHRRGSENLLYPVVNELFLRNFKKKPKRG